ncbi:hypothetical protein OAU50_01910 [Planctomycetota bacterium]|nr:hypothetical protein [Planctomycetota bacterium]
MSRITLLFVLACLSTSICAQARLYNQSQPEGGDLPAGSFKRAVLSFGLAGEFAQDDNKFLGVTIDNMASNPIAASDIITVQLWLDDGDNRFQDSTDELLASKSTGLFPCSFADFASEQILTEGQTKRYFVSVDVTSTATANLNLKLQLNASNVVLDRGSAILDGAAVDGNNFRTVGSTVPVIALVSQPTGAIEGKVLGAQPVLELHDANGNKINDNITEVTASITPGSGDGKLGPASRVTVKAVGGIVTFTGLSIDKAGDDYQLTFTAANFASATSDSFDITAVAPTPTPVASSGSDDDDGFFGCSAIAGDQYLVLLLLSLFALLTWGRKRSLVS